MVGIPVGSEVITPLEAAEQAVVALSAALAEAIDAAFAAKPPGTPFVLGRVGVDDGGDTDWGRAYRRVVVAQKALDVAVDERAVLRRRSREGAP